MNLNKLLGQETPAKWMELDDIRKYVLESLMTPSQSKPVVRVTMIDKKAKKTKPSQEEEYLGLFSGYHLTQGREVVYIIPVDQGTTDEIYLRDIYSIEVLPQQGWIEVEPED